VEGQQREGLKRGLPVWQEGDWWVILSDILVGDLNNPEKKSGRLGRNDLPDDRSTFTVEMKFQVEKPVPIRHEPCDVIGVHPYKLPSGVTDETKGSHCGVSSSGKPMVPLRGASGNFGNIHVL